MRAFLTLALLGIAVATQVGAAEKDHGPDWLRKPTAQDIRAVLPVRAMEKGLSGSATIACEVSVLGRLLNCKVKKETPPGEDFGKAALSMAPQFLMRPAIRDGVPVLSEVTIPINFKLPADVDATSPSAVIPVQLAWKQAPTYRDLVAAYPAKARDTHIGGTVGLNCGFTTEGRTWHCEVISEQPRGYGFWQAAMKTVTLFQLPESQLTPKQIRSAMTQLTITFTPEMLEATKPIIGKPRWAALPPAEAFTATFANVPRNVGTLKVLLECQVQQGGGVDGCAVLREEPTGGGYGAAALKLAPHFKVATWSSEGVPIIGGAVTIPIRYEIETQPAATAPKP